jgi:hypothetical protein
MFNRSFLCYFTGMYIALGLSGVIWEIEPRTWQGVLDTTLSDKVDQ